MRYLISICMFISSGLAALDTFLEGGYVKGRLSLIYGPAATGKTTLALMVALEEAKKRKVFFLDTEGGFSVERVKQMVGDDATSCLENIFVIRIKSFDEQEDVIRTLSKLIEKVDCDLVILDTLGVHYRKELQEDSFKLINARLRKMLDELERISRQYDLSVVINNQVYHDLEGNVKLVGGEMVKSRADKIIELVKNQERYAVFNGKLFRFEIYDGGIRKVG